MPRAIFLAGTVLAAAVLAAPVSAQTVQPATAKQLASLMSERKLDAIAAKDPHDPDRYIAALLIPGVQLLVVSADYPAPPELDAQLGAKNYRDVYSALHQPATAPSRSFFIDLGCDGISSGRGDQIDVLYEKGTAQTLFNGQWRQQGLSEEAYEKKVREAEQQYGRLVSLLMAALAPPPTGA